MRRKWALIGLVAVFAAAAFAIAADKGEAKAAPKKADKVLELIEQGRQAYLKEDHQAALGAFQKVVAELHDRVALSLGAFFPNPPEGWTATEIRIDSTAGPGLPMTELTRTYMPTADKLEVKAVLGVMAVPWGVLSPRGMMEAEMNSGALQATPDLKVTVKEEGAWSIITMVRTGDPPSVSIMGACDPLMLWITSRSAEDGPTRRLLEMFDLNGLAAAVGARQVSRPSNAETEEDVP